MLLYVSCCCSKVTLEFSFQGAGLGRIFFFFNGRLTVAHTTHLSSPCHQCCPKERQWPIMLISSVITGVVKMRLDAMSNCLCESGSIFYSQVLLLNPFQWIGMATKQQRFSFSDCQPKLKSSIYFIYTPHI